MHSGLPPERGLTYFDGRDLGINAAYRGGRVLGRQSLTNIGRFDLRHECNADRQLLPRSAFGVSDRSSLEPVDFALRHALRSHLGRLRPSPQTFCHERASGTEILHGRFDLSLGDFLGRCDRRSLAERQESHCLLILVRPLCRARRPRC